MGQRVCFDWGAAAAIARVAEAAYRPPRVAQRRQSYAYLDNSSTDYGPPERAVFGKDSHVQECGSWICFCCGGLFRSFDFYNNIDFFHGTHFRGNWRCQRSEGMWNAGGRCDATC
jgi:hypothetical protein